MRPAAVRDALQNQSKGGLRNGESFEIIRIFFLDTATVGIHERERSESRWAVHRWALQSVDLESQNKNHNSPIL